MTMTVNYWLTPPRARAGMCYGQYNQIAPYKTGDAGVTAGCIVSFDSVNKIVVNGGAAPAGVVVDTESVLGLGFVDQYKNSVCSVNEQGKAWVKTTDGETFTANSPVIYDQATGQLDSAGKTIENWVVLEDTDTSIGATLIQILPSRVLVADEPVTLQGTAKKNNTDKE